MEFPDKSNPVPVEEVRQPLAPVVSGGVKKSKRPASRRFFDFLFAESPKALTGNIVENVVKPRAKAAVEEALNSFLSGMLWGDPSNRPMSNIVRGTVIRPGGVNYQAISTGVSPTSQAMAANTNRSSGTYSDLACGTQQQAELILSNLIALHNQYRRVAVADLYELANITPAPTDNHYGWTSLETARISKSRDGYVLELPPPVLL